MPFLISIQTFIPRHIPPLQILFHLMVIMSLALLVPRRSALSALHDEAAASILDFTASASFLFEFFATLMTILTKFPFDSHLCTLSIFVFRSSSFTLDFSSTSFCFTRAPSVSVKREKLNTIEQDGTQSDKK